MTALRSLLRLEDKLAAEGRRLQRIGGPPLGHLAPVIVVAAVLLHGAALLLPVLKTHASLPASSPPQDFPLVWRMASPAPSAVAIQAPLGSPPAGGPPRSPSAAPAFIPVEGMEPVPEPSPEFAATAITAEVDAVIPPPDALPLSVEPGPPSSSPSPNPAGPPAIVHRVPPVYPVLARALRAEARVTVRLTLETDGGVGEASVLGCTRPGLGFETAALEAARRWRYETQQPPSGPRTVIVTLDFKRQGERP